MANGKKYSIQVTSILCYGTSDLGGLNDEVYIVYQADGGLPIRYTPVDAGSGKYGLDFYTQSMNSQSDCHGTAVWDWGVSIQIDFDYEALVTLWDQDVKGVNNASEFLINCDYRPGNFPSSYAMSNNNGANYTINAHTIG